MKLPGGVVEHDVSWLFVRSGVKWPGLPAWAAPAACCMQDFAHVPCLRLLQLLDVGLSTSMYRMGVHCVVHCVVSACVLLFDLVIQLG